MAENIMERLNRIGAEKKIADFRVKQKQDYEFKKRYAYIRAWEFYNEAAKREIRCIAKEKSPVADEFKQYWQKDMCKLWDDVKGCLANENYCDSCTSFKRVEPQFCKRCGITFFERKSNDICNACRSARIKQAQRKYAILSNKRRM